MLWRYQVGDSGLTEAYRNHPFGLLLVVGVWYLGAAALPAALLLTARWAWGRAADSKRARAKAMPWRTFEPIGYTLRWSQIFSTPAYVVYDHNREEPVTTTVGAVVNEILPGRFNLPGEPKREKAPVPDSKRFMGDLSVEAPSGRNIRVENIGGNVPSKLFAVDLVAGILQLFRLTEDVHDCVLYFYERDSWYYVDSFGERYKFFVVHGDKIVLEEFELSTLCNSFIDPTVLKPLWEKEEWEKSEDGEGEEHEAEESDGELTSGQKTALRWWYRRFYTETKVGQQRVFWNERLFHYEPPEQREAARDARLRRIEWAVFGLGSLWVLRSVLGWF
jgi:hypothetical protein